jgi:hypothetical protein
MTAKQALGLAKGVSGLNNSEISELAEIGNAEVTRFFKEHDNYYPSMPKIPALSRALGNTILQDWMNEQHAELTEVAPAVTASRVSFLVLKAMSSIGGLHAITADAIADGKVTQQEARNIQAYILGLRNELDRLSAAIEPLATGEIRQ